MTQKGFTLVELSIVMIIIGLLISGILKGQELILNARIAATISQVKNMSGAYHTFYDIYKGVPGDLTDATSKIPNCNTSSCLNGNGDQWIGPVLTGIQANLWWPIPSAITDESVQFWKHLALADLIGGVSGPAVAPGFGTTHPKSHFQGGIFVKSTGIWDNTMHGYTFVFRNNIQGNWMCADTSTTVCAISPAYAARIDQKMDDGNAMTGVTQAVSGSHSSGCGLPGNGNQNANGYDEKNSNFACDIMFMVEP